MAAVFTEILMVFFLQFYIVILALFYGTSVTAEEVENRTLSYLITRPHPQAGRSSSASTRPTRVLMFAMVGVSLALSYFIMNAARLADPDLYGTFFRYLGVLGLGILAYTAFFTFLGAVLKRAIIVGMVFGFGWENVIQYFPGLDAEALHRPLSEVASAVPPAERRRRGGGSRSCSSGSSPRRPWRPS